MKLLLGLLFLLLTIVSLEALVHKLAARRSQFMSDEMALHKETQLKRLLVKDFGSKGRLLWRALNRQHHQKSSATIRVALKNSYQFLTNISVGTPAQNLTVQIDTFFEEDLQVFGSKYNLSKLRLDSPKERVNLYNESASSTFVNITGNYTYQWWTGHLSRDLVNVQGQTANMTFGVLDGSKSITYLSADGQLGLGIGKSSSNITNAVTQLLENADKPVITQYWNLNGSNSSGVITLGAEDSENCASEWTYVPGIGSFYSFTVNSATANVNGTDKTLVLNSTAILLPYFSGIYTSNEGFSLFANASNAVYNSTTGKHQVDCDLSKAQDVVLSIGNSTEAKQLVLTGTDFIAYNKRRDSCYLNVRGLWGFDGYLIVGATLGNNHCLAYNTKEELIGFADVKNKRPVKQTSIESSIGIAF